MITVRFPSGFSVQYNTANYCVHERGWHTLRTKEGGDWVACVPFDCIVEYITPCRTYNPISERTADRLDGIEKELRSIKRKIKP